MPKYLAPQAYKPKHSLGNFLVPARQALASFFGYPSGTPMTPEMEEWMRKLLEERVARTGEYTGTLDYNDYNYETANGQNPLAFTSKSGLFSPETGWGATLGKADYSINSDIEDDDYGKVTWTGGTDYNFGDNIAWGFDVINKGGLFGDEEDRQKYAPKISLWR